MPQPWPNDPDDDGSPLVGVLYAALINAGIVVLVLLLYRLFC